MSHRRSLRTIPSASSYAESAKFTPIHYRKLWQWQDASICAVGRGCASGQPHRSPRLPAPMTRCACHCLRKNARAFLFQLGLQGYGKSATPRPNLVQYAWSDNYLRVNVSMYVGANEAATQTSTPIHVCRGICSEGVGNLPFTVLAWRRHGNSCAWGKSDMLAANPIWCG
jgi:hypothetical protein